MFLDFDVRRVDEHGLQVFRVLFETFRFVTVGPRHHDVRRVAFPEPIPFLVAEHVEIQVVEIFQVLLDCRSLPLMFGRRRLRMFPRGLRGRTCCERRCNSG